DRVCTGLDERVAALEPAALDAWEAHRDPLSGGGALDRLVVYLNGAHAHVEARRLDPQRVALADRPRPERAGDDRADAPEPEDAVDVEPDWSIRVRALGRVGRRRERGPQPVEALARLRP